MKTIKYSDSARCPKCNGLLSYDARMTDSLPMGLGFAPGSAKFCIDVIERKGWRGECMECQTQVFAVVSQTHKRKFPASVNRKIRDARKLAA